MADLQTELKQSKPFESLQQEVMLNILRTSAVLTHRIEQEFRPFGLTSTQFNVLRIVAGAGPCGIGQCGIASRLVAQTPDVPRLLKRTEAAGLIRRTPSKDDKRVLSVCITPKGAKLLAEVSHGLPFIMEGLFPKLTPTQLRMFNKLLNDAREQNPLPNK